MGSNRPRRQHLVSAFYLRGFASDNRRVTCAPRDGANEFITSVDDAAVRKNFYTIPLPGGSESYALEEAMGEIESSASPVLDSILSGSIPPIGSAARVELARWIALQYLRTATNRRLLAQGLAVADALPADSVPAREELQGLLEDAVVGAGDGTAEKKPMAIAASLPAVAELIANCPWAVSRFKHRSLVTSDHPVFLMPKQSRAHRGLGVANAAAVGIPLSRGVGLLAWVEHVGAQFEGWVDEPTAKAARLFNLYVMLNSERHVLRHPDDVLPESVSSFDGLAEPRLRLKVSGRGDMGDSDMGGDA